MLTRLQAKIQLYFDNPFGTPPRFYKECGRQSRVLLLQCTLVRRFSLNQLLDALVPASLLWTLSQPESGLEWTSPDSSYSPTRVSTFPAIVTIFGFSSVIYGNSMVHLGNHQCEMAHTNLQMYAYSLTANSSPIYTWFQSLFSISISTRGKPWIKNWYTYCPYQENSS